MSKAWTPSENQLAAVEGMVSKPGFGALAKPGFGKTSTTLAASTVLLENKAARGILIVAPLRPAYEVWPAEIALWSDFAHLKHVILHGPNKLAALQSKADIYIINYEGLPWLAEQLAGMKVWPFDVLCLDESHKVKNTGTVRYKTLKALRAKFSRVWILTGSPAPNGIEDLFGQIYLLDGGARLGKFVTHFRRQYFHEFPQRGGYSLWEPRKGSGEEVLDKIADITVSFDSPPKPGLTENIIKVHLPAAAQRVYQGIEDDFFAELASGAVTAANAAAKSMKLRQVTAGSVIGTMGVQVVHEVKIEALLDLIEEQAGNPIIVAVQFLHEVEAIRAALKQDVPYVGDGISPNALRPIVADWNAGKIPVLLGHPSTISLGLNLQAGGSTLVWFNLTWSQTDWEQTIARVWRQGQTQACVVHYIIASDTIDERMLEVVRSKDRAQNALMLALRLAARN